MQLNLNSYNIILKAMLNPIFYKYLITVIINVAVGKYVSTLYATSNKLNPYLSISLIILSETLSCAILFFIGFKLKSLKFFGKLFNSKKTRKAHDYVLRYGPIIGLFVGQMFVGAPLISLALGLIYEEKKNVFLFFFIPLFISITMYAIFNFYLNTMAIISLRNIFQIF